MTARFSVKFAALCLALTLWLLVSAEEQVEKWVSVKVDLVTDSNVALVGEVPEVQALIGGPGREMLKLATSEPEIHRVVGADTPDEVQIDLRPGDVIIPGNADVRVRDVTPRAVTLNFNVTEQRYVPINAAVRSLADSGLRITRGPRVRPDSALVRGPRSAVQNIDSLTTARADVVVRDTLTVRTIPLDTAGLGLIAVTPPAVRVYIRAARVAPPPPSPVTGNDSTTVAAPGSAPAPAPATDTEGDSTAPDDTAGTPAARAP